MSRHIRAQTTPTHASGFHLFTVAMTGHAEEKGFSYPSMQQLNRFCPNAVKESRSERVGLYRNEQGGFCLPGTSEDSIESSLVSTITTPEQRLPRGNNTGKQSRNTINAMHNMMHAITWHYECVLG